MAGIAAAGMRRLASSDSHGRRGYWRASVLARRMGSGRGWGRGPGWGFEAHPLVSLHCFPTRLSHVYVRRRLRRRLFGFYSFSCGSPADQTGYRPGPVDGDFGPGTAEPFGITK